MVNRSVLDTGHKCVRSFFVHLRDSSAILGSVRVFYLQQETPPLSCGFIPWLVSLVGVLCCSFKRFGAVRMADFLEKVVSVLREEGFLNDARSKVVDFKHPAELETLVPFSLGVATDNEQNLLEEIRSAVRLSVQTNHRHFYNQLFSAPDEYGLAGAWITEALNTSQYTYEVAPVFTLTERAVLNRVLRLVGFPNDGDGIFTPGGSISNMYAIVAARYRAFPNVKTDGMQGLPPMAIFTSDDSHYSIAKGAHWLGFGTSSVVYVKTDDGGRMIPEDLAECLEKSIKEGKTPLLVNTTAGTTVLGAGDPFDAIADICRNFKVWMHVDACWGGALMLSKKYRAPLKGIERADSVAWCPHKMLGAPLQCSLIVVRERGLLHRCNSAAATYLFQQDKFYDTSYDTGDKSVQCGRKVDAFKLWLMWRARGDAGLESLVDNAMECARYCTEQIRNRTGFELVSMEAADTAVATNVCFWYLPMKLRDRKDRQSDSFKKELAAVAPAIKEKMALTGTLLVGYCPLLHKGLVNFFRLVTTCQPPPTTSDMDFVLDEIEKLGRDL